MSTHAAARLAWSLCTLTVVLVACVVVFAVFYQDNRRDLALLLGVVSNALVGAVLTSHRPRNPVGWFFVFSAASLAVSEAMFRYAVYGLVIDPGSLPLARAMAWPPNWLWVPGVVLILVFLPLYFPNGRLLSPRWRPVMWLALFVSVTLAVFWAFAPGAKIGVRGVTNPLGIEALRPVAGALGDFVTGMLLLVVILASLVSLVVRFRRSRGEERQQIKWLALAASPIPVWILINAPIQAAAPNLFQVVDALIVVVVVALIPVAVGVAILRYNLYDIDQIINRTLVYGSLTATLALVYVGGVVGLQSVFRALTGQESTLAVVASTLVIAALFGPLRRRVQAFVDRRFYRKKYDATKTLEAFSAKLRDETDLGTLNDHLLGVVSETMQPAHVSLWLRPETSSKGEQAG